MMGSNPKGQQTGWEGHSGVESGEVLVEQRGFYSYTDVAPCLASAGQMRGMCGYCCCWEGSFPVIATNCNVPVKVQNE